jgi:hypothetical protein
MGKLRARGVAFYGICQGEYVGGEGVALYGTIRVSKDGGMVAFDAFYQDEQQSTPLSGRAGMEIGVEKEG